MFLAIVLSFITLLTSTQVSEASLFSVPTVYQRIYKQVDDIKACFRLLNATHQIGCSATPSNVSGVVWYVETQDNITTLLEKHPHSPYIVVMEPHLFTAYNVRNLKDSGHVNGIVMYYNITGSIPPELSVFSPAKTCPNSEFNSDCDKWNINGSQLTYDDFDNFAIFTILSEESYQEVIQCFNDHNRGGDGGLDDYPLCSAELQADMQAVISTVECYQRANIWTNLGLPGCQPLGDNNVWASLFEIKENTDIIMVATKLDSSALIPDLSFGGNNEVSGIVTQLAVAEVLGKLKQNGMLTELEKQIMFVFFQGESFDYIGSSRMVYDMIRGSFLDQPPLLNITNISSFLELSQVGIQTNTDTTTPTYYLHSNAMTSSLYSKLKDLNRNITFNETTANQLPPSSAQMFLRENNSIPTIIITDYDKKFNNKFYGSRYDTIDNLLSDDDDLSVSSPVVLQLTELATSIAQVLLDEAGGPSAPSIAPSADPETVSGLLECFLIRSNCSLLRTVLNSDWVAILDDKPVSRYVTVNTISNYETEFVHNLLAYFTGKRNNNLTTCDQCDNAETDSDQSKYTTMSGNSSDDTSCMCYESFTHRHEATSPAFEMKDYDSKKYSTWTESNWGGIGMRIYLVTYTLFEVSIFIAGLTLSVISIFIAWQCSRKSKLVFAVSANNVPEQTNL